MDNNLEIITPEVVGNSPATAQISEANRLQAFIIDCNNQAKRYSETGILATIRLGGLLCEIKADCKHGEWLSLFNDSGKRLKSEPNYPHVGNFSFAHSSAQRYMAVHKEFMARLGDKEIEQFKALPEMPCADFEIESCRKVLSKAIGEAETPRQMMLSLGVISDQKGANLDAGDRNTKGRPRKPAPSQEPPTPEQVDEALELERKDAEAHAAQLADSVLLFIRLERPTLICRESRRHLAALLANTADALNQVND